MDGSVAGDLRAYGERIVVNGSVDGDVEFSGEDLRLGPDARIGGRVVYRSSDDIVVDSGAQVAGNVSKSTGDRAWRKIAHGASIVGGITVSLGMVLLGAVLVLGMPRFSREAGVAIRGKPWHVLGLGCAMLIGVPVALAVLLVTIVGIPLAVLLAFAYGAILMLGFLIAAIFVGDFVLERIDATEARFGLVACAFHAARGRRDCDRPAGAGCRPARLVGPVPGRHRRIHPARLAGIPGRSRHRALTPVTQRFLGGNLFDCL